MQMAARKDKNQQSKTQKWAGGGAQSCRLCGTAQKKHLVPYKKRESSESTRTLQPKSKNYPACMGV